MFEKVNNGNLEENKNSENWQPCMWCDGRQDDCADVLCIFCDGNKDDLLGN